jgi:4-amino-4-deoxy-L-arabinose transferase-like glycosyltransferase
MSLKGTAGKASSALTYLAPFGSASQVLAGVWARLAPGLSRLVPLWLLILAVVTRIVPWLATYPLHVDEALYGYWARLIATGTDPLLLSVWVDKPPLVLYALAGSLSLFGVSELALRLPAMLASVMQVPILFALAGQVHGRRLALVTALMVVLSPFAILFAPTAFTDPWLVLWELAALWAAWGGRGWLAGLALGLAVASKQQGVLLAPLVLALLIAGCLTAQKSSLTASPAASGAQRPSRRWYVALGLFVLGLAPILGAVYWWDAQRWINRTSFWERSLTTYGGLFVVPIGEYPIRLAQWAQPLGLLWGFPVLTAAVLLLSAAAFVLATRRIFTHRPTPLENDNRREWFVFLAGGYVGAYALVHLGLTFQPWDRYLAPLVPLLALLAVDGGERLWQFRLRCGRHVGRGARFLALAVAILAVAWSAALGVGGRLPLGSDHGVNSGVRQVAEFLRDQPSVPVVYYRSLGWYFDFYLYGSAIERRWWDTPGKLLSDARATFDESPTQPQMVVFSSGEQADQMLLREALAQEGWQMRPVLLVHRPDGSVSFTVDVLSEEASNAAH